MQVCAHVRSRVSLFLFNFLCKLIQQLLFLKWFVLPVLSLHVAFTVNSVYERQHVVEQDKLMVAQANLGTLMQIFLSFFQGFLSVSALKADLITYSHTHTHPKYFLTSFSFSL